MHILVVNDEEVGDPLSLKENLLFLFKNNHRISGEISINILIYYFELHTLDSRWEYTIFKQIN